jgi:outer membrane protein
VNRKRFLPIRSAVLFALLAAAGTFPAYAGDALTLADCLKEASLRNPELVQARAEVREAGYGKKQAAGRFLPSVSAGASANKSGNGGSFSGLLGEGDSSASYGVNLSLSENLFNGFKDKASYDSASAQKQMAEASLRQTLSQVACDLRKNFTSLLYAQQQVLLLEDIARRQKTNTSMVELQYESGKENKGSLLNSQAAAAQADYEVLQARRSLRLAQRELNRIIGRSLLGETKVEGTFDVTPPPAESPDFKALSAEVPSVVIAQTQLKSAKSQVTSAKGEFLPTLNASGSLSRSGESWVPEGTSWRAGLSLSLPLFSGGQDYYSLKSAQSKRDRAETSLEAAKLDAALSIENTYWSFLNAVGFMQVQSKFLSSAQVQEEVAQAQYANGLLSYQNWDQIVSSLVSRRKSELQSRRDTKNAEAQWDLSRGVYPPEFDSKP